MAEKMTLTLLSSYLDDGGWHTEAGNVRNGVDLESYENEIRLIAWLNRHLTQPAQAVEWKVPEIKSVLPDASMIDRWRAIGWNECRNAMLDSTTPPQPEE